MNPFNDLPEINTLLSKYVDTIMDDRVITLLGNHLFKAGIINPQAHLGSESEKTTLKNEVSKANLSAATINPTLSQTVVGLAEIYKDKKTKSRQMFTLCMIAIAVCIILLFAGIIIAFMQENNNKITIITSMSSLVPAVLGGTAFLVYNKTNEELQSIEQEVIKLQRLGLFFEMIDDIKDKDAKRKAYDNIVGQMK